MTEETCRYSPLVVALARHIVGPRTEPPAHSPFTLAALQEHKWNTIATEAERADALYTAETMVAGPLAGLLRPVEPEPAPAPSRHEPIWEVSPAQIEKIARLVCKNLGQNPDTLTGGRGILGNLTEYPLWREKVQEVRNHLAFVAAVMAVLDPDEPVVTSSSRPEEVDAATRDALRATLARAEHDNEFLGETVRRRAERSTQSS